MKYRKLRIAWSVAWGVVCLLLVALWVRSYYYQDVFEAKTSWRQFQIKSWPGRLEFSQLNVQRMFRSKVMISPQEAQIILKEMSQGKWHVSRPVPKRSATRRAYVRLGFNWQNEGASTMVAAPYWSVVLLFVALAAAPGVKWSRRFSLRTLLIAMTLAAVGLGLAVYAFGK